MAVISGMAIGIDSSAHAGALEAGGLTVAVLGSGVDVPYPRRAGRLYEEIVERGLVLSELPPGTGARRWTFPARNRIMAALGGMTVVVEARDRSGSLITAELADQLGRDVGAVPGRVGNASAAGTNSLLRDGAALIRGAADVLDTLVGAGAGSRMRATGPPLEPELGRVLELVERGAGNPDALARGAGLDAGGLASALFRLELAGYLRPDSAGRYERTALAAPEPRTDPH
jgi:DNA processing protein